MATVSSFFVVKFPLEIFFFLIYSLFFSFSQSYPHALTYLQIFNTKILDRENDGVDLHHDQARWRPKGLGTWAFSFFIWKRNFFFTMNETCVWRNQKFRNGKESFGLYFVFFPIFLRPELASSWLNLNWVCGFSFVLYGGFSFVLCSSDFVCFQLNLNWVCGFSFVLWGGVFVCLCVFICSVQWCL